MSEAADVRRREQQNTPSYDCRKACTRKAEAQPKPHTPQPHTHLLLLLLLLEKGGWRARRQMG